MSLSERVCPVCGKPFAKQNEDGSSGNALGCTLCGQCGYLYHDECWDKIERCAVFGCRCTHSESVSKTLNLPTTIKCQACGNDNPYKASLCSKCGEPLEARFVGKIFSSNSAKDRWQASTDKELILKADKDWNASVRYLYNGDFEYWLANNGYEELAQKAKEARQNNRQRSVGLEVFLESSGYVNKPILNLSNDSLAVECADDEVDTIINVSNAGRGYLYGTLRADVDWIIAQPQEFASNSQRIMLTLDMTALGGSSGEGKIVFKTSGGERTVTVKASRIAVSTAISLYREGNYFKARALGRKLLDNRISIADASVLCAACCLHEENYIGAVSDLRRLSGKCKTLPGDIAANVYAWLKNEPAQAVTLEKSVIYEAIAEVADENLKKDLRKDLARVIIDRASMSVDSGSGNASLWGSGKKAAKNIKETLKQAENLDPELAKEASAVRKRLRSGKSLVSLPSCFIACLLALALVMGGVFYIQNNKKIDLLSLGQGRTADLIGGDFSSESNQLRIEFQNSPSDVNIRAKYASSLLGLAEEAAASHVYSLADSYTRQALEIGGADVYSAGIVQARMLNWAQELQNKQLEGEAYIRCRQALKLGANSELEAMAQKLTIAWESYYEVFSIVNSLFYSGSIYVSSDESYQKAAQKLASLGVYMYKTRVSCTYVDMTGNGQRDLLVAGSDDPASELVSSTEEKKDTISSTSLSGNFAVYSWKGAILGEVYSKKVNGFPHLVNMQCANINSQSKEEALLIWNFLDNPDTLLGIIIGCVDRKFLTTERVGNLHFDVADHDNNGRSEVWISAIVANSTDPGNAVYIPSPYSWNGRNLIAASGDFSSFYTKLSQSLDEQIKNNPYPEGSDLRRLYHLDRQKAKDWIKKQISKRTTAPELEQGKN